MPKIISKWGKDEQGRERYRVIVFEEGEELPKGVLNRGDKKTRRYIFEVAREDMVGDLSWGLAEEGRSALLALAASVYNGEVRIVTAEELESQDRFSGRAGLSFGYGGVVRDNEGAGGPQITPLPLPGYAEGGYAELDPTKTKQEAVEYAFEEAKVKFQKYGLPVSINQGSVVTSRAPLTALAQGITCGFPSSTPCISLNYETEEKGKTIVQRIHYIYREDILQAETKEEANTPSE